MLGHSMLSYVKLCPFSRTVLILLGQSRLRYLGALLVGPALPQLRAVLRWDLLGFFSGYSLLPKSVFQSTDRTFLVAVQFFMPTGSQAFSERKPSSNSTWYIRR